MLGECLFISSLPGKALRMLVDSICVLKAEPGKLYIKRRKFISIQADLLFKLAIMTYLQTFVSIQCH